MDPCNIAPLYLLIDCHLVANSSKTNRSCPSVCLHRTPYLVTQLIGDLLLLIGAGAQPGSQGILIGHPKEATNTEQGCKRARVSGSSNHREAYQVINEVVSPRGACTSIHCSPLVASLRDTPVACSSSIIRVAGEAFQRRSCKGLSSFYLHFSFR